MAESQVRDREGGSSRPLGATPNGVAPGALREPPRSATDSLVTGVLVKHGRAPYGFQGGGQPSYFVTVNTERGERTLWGRGLERAIADSHTQPQPGEAVGVRENGITPMTVVTRERNLKGEVVTVNRADTPRGHWVIERRDWFDERMAAAEALRDARISRREAIRNHPLGLVSVCHHLSLAAEFASHRIPDPEDRQRFVDAVRQALEEPGAPDALQSRQEGDTERGHSRTANRAPARGRQEMPERGRTPANTR
ncbi:MAG: hypothetical protein ACREV7_16235 [Steroidobacteraceae bacterium]